ncbi:hypothetical protein [Thermus filiformis]|uniref:Uncharacterized protein n=1 Tax=Thermus filiformis TaxID=276 RepID=A0A0A2WTU5_THEFI|nr:hypothetical protein THFILI_09755 [Thermus filiformis]
MQGVLERATVLLREARPTGRDLPKLQEAARLLESLRPGPERDALLALAYLRMYQVARKEEYYLRGYSYARTSGKEEALALAERAKEGA